MKTSHKLYVHVQQNLTILFTAIAGMILVLMSAGYLYMSEREWHENNWLSFLNTSNTIISNIEHLDTIPFSWLSTVAAENNFILGVYDNDTLLSYSEISLSEQEKELAASALNSVLKQLKKTLTTAQSAKILRSAQKTALPITRTQRALERRRTCSP